MGDPHVKAGEVVSRKTPSHGIFRRRPIHHQAGPSNLLHLSNKVSSASTRSQKSNRGTPLASPADPANFNLSNCFSANCVSPIKMDAATVTVISGNLVMPKNRLPSRTLQISHCQLFFQARQHLSVENSAVQD
jgi:hypothetical protein